MVRGQRDCFEREYWDVLKPVNVLSSIIVPNIMNLMSSLTVLNVVNLITELRDPIAD